MIVVINFDGILGSIRRNVDFADDNELPIRLDYIGFRAIIQHG